MAVDFDFEKLLRSGMATDIGVREATDRLAGRVADKVKEFTPEFGDLPPHRNSPAYGSPGDAKDAITVEAHPREPLARRVISRDFKAIWIEVGTKHMPEYAPFAKAAKLFGGTGPLIGSVEEAQHGLRGELEKLAKLTALGNAGHIAAQAKAVHEARQARTAAFNAARPRRRGRRR